MRPPGTHSTIGLVALGLAAAPAAGAQVPQPPPPSTPPPAPQPQAGKASVHVGGGLATKKARYVMRGQRVLVSGTVKPFVAGQAVTVELRRRKKVVARKRVQVRQGKKGGTFSAQLKARRRGTVHAFVRHKATAQQKAFSDRGGKVKVVVWRAGKGAHGTKVLLLQRGLQALGFGTPVSGGYDDGTSRAVLAFRKTNDMKRTGYASPAVYRKVLAHRGAFKLRYPRAGKHVEFDWSRQVLVLADKGRPVRVYHASSGKPSTPTVFGTYSFYSKTPGVNSHDMLDSNYFVRGYAVHGYPEVPAYAASHGCIRIPNPNAASVFAWIRLGDRIFVYR